MNCIIEFTEEESINVIKVKGPFTFRGFNEYLEDHARDQKISGNKFLLDLTESVNQNSIIQMYEFAYCKQDHLTAEKFWKKTVLLINPDDRTFDFLETVAINSGSLLKIFRDRSSAVDCLNN